MPTTPAAPPLGPIEPPTDRRYEIHLVVLGPVEDDQRATLDRLVLTAADSDAERTTSSRTPRYYSTGALTTDAWALRALVDSLELAQADGTLLPLAYQAYACPGWSQYGTVVMHTPDLGTFEGRCDFQGEVVLSGTEVAAALAGAGQDPAAALSHLAGMPWSIALGLTIPATTAAGT